MNLENISFFLEDKNKEEESEIDLSQLINEFNLLKNPNLKKPNIEINKDKNIQEIETDLKSYNLNELYKIVEYYGLLKNIKIAKYKKTEIVFIIKMFELNEENKLIVEKRKKLWFYLNEIMKDKIMKKYVIW